MRYCGVVPAGDLLQLAILEEVREPEPPIRLNAVFFEPASAAEVAGELTALGDVVAAIASPLSDPLGGAPARASDIELRRRGLQPAAPHREARRLAGSLG